MYESRDVSHEINKAEDDRLEEKIKTRSHTTKIGIESYVDSHDGEGFCIRLTTQEYLG